MLIEKHHYYTTGKLPSRNKTLLLYMQYYNIAGNADSGRIYIRTATTLMRNGFDNDKLLELFIMKVFLQLSLKNFCAVIFIGKTHWSWWDFVEKRGECYHYYIVWNDTILFLKKLFPPFPFCKSRLPVH